MTGSTFTLRVCYSSGPGLGNNGPENKNFQQPCDFGSAQLNLGEISQHRILCITIRRPIPPPPQKSISRENGFLEGSR
jgi:hypothetical protein